MIPRQVNPPERVRRLRTALGISQADLAQSVSVPITTLSKLENGRIDLDSELLAAIARELECSPGFLSGARPETIATNSWLRAYADASKRAVDAYRADSITAIETATHLNLKLMPEVLPSFDGDANNDDDIENAAKEVRSLLEVDADGVVPNVIRAAERLGCVVLPMESELGRHLGLSMRINGVPTIRVAKAPFNEDGTIPGDRQRFTVAHELAHLILHSADSPPTTSEGSRRIERQAHRFAGAFLAPGDAITEDLRSLGGRITLNTLAHLKHRWGIAIKALVVRFQQLDVIDAEHARSLYKQISARGWNTGEPVPVYPEKAVWMSLALKKNFGGQCMDQVSHASELDPSWFLRWTNWDLSKSAEVIPIDRSRSRDPAPMDERFLGAAVTNLPIRKW